jgi:hypothetical protein
MVFVRGAWQKFLILNYILIAVENKRALLQAGLPQGKSGILPFAGQIEWLFLPIPLTYTPPVP